MNLLTQRPFGDLVTIHKMDNSEPAPATSAQPSQSGPAQSHPRLHSTPAPSSSPLTGLRSSFLPFSIHDDQTVLRAHLNRVNRQWEDEGEALVIFHGPYSYISPTWSPSTRSGNSVAPTLNYEIVHVYGTLTAYDDPEWITQHMADLSKQTASEWDYHSIDMRWLKRMVPATVGIEIKINRIEAKAKMSQNAKAGDIEGIIAGLTASGADPDIVKFLTEISLPYAQDKEQMVDSLRSFTVVAKSVADGLDPSNHPF